MQNFTLPKIFPCFNRSQPCLIQVMTFALSAVQTRPFDHSFVSTTPAVNSQKPIHRWGMRVRHHFLLPMMFMAVSKSFAFQFLAWLQQNFAGSPRLADWRTSKPEGSMVGLDSRQHAMT